MTALLPTIPVPVLAPRSVMARVAFSDPPGWLYVAFSPRLDNLGAATAHAVTLDLYPIAQQQLIDAGCLIWTPDPHQIEPRIQAGDPTLISLERAMEEGLHAQQIAGRSLPPLSFAVGIPLELLPELPAGWLPLFETADTTRDLDRPGVWECGVPSDQVFGICRYAYAPDAVTQFDHFVALPFDRIYVPLGWNPPPALVDVDGN